MNCLPSTGGIHHQGEHAARPCAGRMAGIGQIPECRAIRQGNAARSEVVLRGAALDRLGLVPQAHGLLGFGEGSAGNGGLVVIARWSTDTLA